VRPRRETKRTAAACDDLWKLVPSATPCEQLSVELALRLARRLEPQIGRPLSPYALSKNVNEMYAQIFANCYGFESIGLRYFNVFGPRQDPNGAYAAVIPKWIAGMIRDDPVFINGDGETVRDFCYVDNVIQANLLAAVVDNPAAVNQVYNVALNEKTTLNELFESIRSLLEPLHHVRPVHRESCPGEVRLSQADIGKARRLLGYRPLWRTDQGLAHAIDWYVSKLAPPRATHGQATQSRAVLPTKTGILTSATFPR